MRQPAWQRSHIWAGKCLSERSRIKLAGTFAFLILWDLSILRVQDGTCLVIGGEDRNVWPAQCWDVRVEDGL